jgi:hypothetical protein
MKYRVLIVILLVLCQTGNADVIDFSQFSPGDPIEGLGTVHPLLEITTSGGLAVALFPGELPGNYGAPNDEESIRNGGMTASGGFGDPTARVNDFVFTFASGYTAESFSVRMLDHGDFNPGHAASHTISLVARDSTGQVLDSHVLSYTSDTAGNPTTGSAGNLQLTGDAVTASSGEPGRFAFAVSGSDIARVELVHTNNGSRPSGASSDPNIGFDYLDIVFDPASGVGETELDVPAPNVLRQNSPNPFSRATSISFVFARGGLLDLAVYDISGTRVRVLLRGPLSQGVHSVLWDGCDDHGRTLCSGVYLYRLATGDQVHFRKAILLR